MRRLAAVALAAAAVVPAAHAAPSPTLRISFPEGFSARQMTDRVAAVRRIAIRKRHVRPLLTGKAYRAAVAKARPPAGFGHPSSVEGFLFPSTYTFGQSTRAQQLVTLQLQAFAREWRRVGSLDGRRPYDVLTVASMVEREVAVPAERPLVSAVIWIRLAKGMPLGIDATLRYGLGIPGTRPLTKVQLASDSPYNTRRFSGLPPTPIGNPGLASMRAAAHPAAVDYLYYVRKPHSLHHFFTSDEQEFCAKVLEYGYGGC
jgi:uncharacterized YceG family protein